MFQSIKRIGLFLALMIAGANTVFGYAIGGPKEYWMDVSIGYGLSGSSLGLGDDGGAADVMYPKNYHQGYRWNTPTNYYVIDFGFENYFGVTGASNIDAAFQMYNNLGQLSAIDLNQYPLQNPTSRNYRAKALQLVDLKSTMMSLMIEQLGLAQPDRWTWCLVTRNHIANAPCYVNNYEVTQRNFDPHINGTYSSYVNDVFYDFYILELCAVSPNPYAPLLADAIEQIPDPAYRQDAYSSVAAMSAENNYGSFYLTFTRDDIGGLMNLYSPSNIYQEMAESNSVMITTNTRVTFLTNLDLALFEQQALTNNDAALLALYPNLVILTNLTTNWFTNVITTNVSAFIQNPPYGSAGLFTIGLQTNYTTNFQQLYFRTYGNLEIINQYSKGFVTTQTIQAQSVTFGTPGLVQLVTNNVTKVQNFVNGEFYILPTNLCGPYDFITTAFTSITTNTNVVPMFTNINAIITNTPSTNFTTANFSESIFTYFTNKIYAVYEIDCVTNNNVAARGGMDGFHFVRVPDTNYDSVRRVFYTPITNVYQLTAWSNGVPIIQTFQRVLYSPDITITGGVFPNMVNGPGSVLLDGAVDRPTPQFNSSQVLPGNFGPGTIQPTGLVFTFNTFGPVYYNNFSSFFLSPEGPLGTYAYASTNSQLVFNWGSFDGTTNAPIVYPDTNSSALYEAQLLGQYEQQLFYQVVSPALPNASVSVNNANNPYSYSLNASASMVSPVSWSLTTNSASMPPGMNLSRSGTISGSPTAVGTYDFNVQATDSSGKVAQKTMALTVVQ